MAARVWTKLLVVFFAMLASGLNAQDGAVHARAGDQCVALNWMRPKGADRFQVFRAEESGGPFREVAGSPSPYSHIADTAVENGRIYFYRVEADGKLIGTPSATPRPFATDDDFLEFLQATAFDYFWHEANPENGLVRDRSTRTSPSSIAAVGFGLTGIAIGVERGWIGREAGAERVARTLRAFLELPQSAEPEATGYKGWFYHFLDMETGLRVWKCELSSIDTALLLCGVLDASEFFDREEAVEREIRSIARRLFERVDWRWMLNGEKTLTMGWHPERGFIEARWRGYNEASILYLLAMGASGENRLEREQWDAWTVTYEWKRSFGLEFVHFPPLFGHQYSALWVDFRGIQDDYMRAKEITYFENSRRATLAQRAYSIDNPLKHRGYGANVWGLTACDGPKGYGARGTPPPENDDGTIAPTAAGGSLPFAPVECVAALRHMYSQYRTKILCGYGFRDAFNLSQDWWATDVLGIDQGAILIMAENLRSGRVWERMRRNEVLRRGLERAGFRRERL